MAFWVIGKYASPMATQNRWHGDEENVPSIVMLDAGVK
jgi:hypothetical protein